MRKQLFAQHRVTAQHEADQLLDLLPERAHDANAGERLSHSPVDQLHIPAHRAVNRTDATRKDQAQHHHARDDGQGGDGELPVEGEQDPDSDNEPNGGDGGRDDGHLEQAGRGLDVAGQAGQDAACLHVPESRQRQVQQPLVERAPQRENHPHVQDPLAIVLEPAADV